MAGAFRPSVTVSVSRNYQGEFDNSVSNKHIQREFPTYAEVKKRMRDLLEISDNNEVSVYRSRRGEWGEWIEKWAIIDGKPKIFKQGWQ